MVGVLRLTPVKNQMSFKKKYLNYRSNLHQPEKVNFQKEYKKFQKKKRCKT